MEDERCSRVNHRGTKIDLAQNRGGEAESMSLYKRGLLHFDNCRTWGNLGREQEVRGPEDAPVWLNS